MSLSGQAGIPPRCVKRTAGQYDPIERTVVLDGTTFVLTYDPLRPITRGGSRSIRAGVGSAGGREAGYLTWYADNTIADVGVHPPHQRKGLASAMLALAREIVPDLQHSHALTEDGRAWSQAVGSKTSEAEMVRYHGTSVGAAKEILAYGARPGLNLTSNPDAARQYARYESGGTAWTTDKRKQGVVLEVRVLPEEVRAGEYGAESFVSDHVVTTVPIPADRVRTYDQHTARRTAAYGDHSTAQRLYGQGFKALFPGDALSANMPFPTWVVPNGFPNNRYRMDRDAIARALASPRFEDFDPRTLVATQGGVVRDAVRHYTQDDSYALSGVPYADADQEGNQRPMVYVFADGTNLIVYGHHRAIAALLKGESLSAIRVDDPAGTTAARASLLGHAHAVRGPLPVASRGPGDLGLRGGAGDPAGQDRGAARWGLARGRAGAGPGVLPRARRAPGGDHQGRTAGVGPGVFYHVTRLDSWPSIREHGLDPMRALYGGGPGKRVWLFDNVESALAYAEGYSNPAVPPCIVVVRSDRPRPETNMHGAYTAASISASEVYDVIRPGDFHFYT